ncbi:hypothetical protein SAMN05216296_2646 [Pseudomonas pohangensis]|uniref:Pyocin activator protein PrtN n=1 Tax=Pseudomonas pohangensis TaxID=364197 RepID=A0A1H2GZ56_9PSED|nr:hypothetical protein [Pseudomonas pohangensis]SDU24900.1 hypothetical protein SAMN05216296_2646 [Pseudomonas pohangensis]
MPKPTDFLTLSAELEQLLTTRYGVMLGSKDLWRELGFRSPSAFRQALVRGTLDLAVFEVQNRRGRFALAKDVAVWLTEQRMSAPNLCLPAKDSGTGINTTDEIAEDIT